MHFKKGLTCILFLFIINLNTYGQEPAVLTFAKKELDRTMVELKKQPVPPYYISLTIFDNYKINLVSSFGKVKTEDTNHIRT